MTETPRRPLRIEMATSEIDSGSAVGWADPARVVGCVALSQPRDAFERFVLPALKSAAEPTSAESSLPPGVQRLLAGLKASHARLYRENHSFMKEPKRVQVTAACAEEGRIYFVRSGPGWIYLVRGSRAHAVGAGKEEAIGDGSNGVLGAQKRLGMQVTSLRVEAEDIVLLVVSEAGEQPDLRAVAGLFLGTKDLKRGCDGLANLLGLQSPGASVVAFRFSPLLRDADTCNLDPARGEAILGEISEMARDLVFGVTSGSGQVRGYAKDLVSVEVDSSGDPAVASPSSGEGEEVGAAGEADTQPESRETGGPEPREERDRKDLARAPRRMRGSRRGSELPIFVASGLLFLIAYLLLAQPRLPILGNLARSFSSLGGTGRARAHESGYLVVSSTPPGALVHLDERETLGTTPTAAVRVGVGDHRVTVDLGVLGRWDRRVGVEAGGTTYVAVEPKGTLLVRAEDTGVEARAWLDGSSQKRPVPCAFEGLAAGWHRLFFEDDRFPLWERRVFVRGGETTLVAVNNAFSAGNALIHVDSYEMVPGHGLVPCEGDSVFIDRLFAGTTPLEKELPPGLHGVRIRHAGLDYAEVLDLPAGASKFVSPRFGLSPLVAFRHKPIGRVVAEGPVLLAAEIDPRGTDIEECSLVLPRTRMGRQYLKLSMVDSTSGLYVARVDTSLVGLGTRIPYYFCARMRGGATQCSELYEFEAVRSLQESRLAERSGSVTERQ